MTTEVRRIKLTEAKPDELVLFARTVLGCDLSPKATADEAIAAMKAVGYGLDTIAITPPPQPASRMQTGAANSTMEASEVIVWDGVDEFGIKRARRLINIMISNQDRPGGDDPVPLGVNGNHLFVARRTPSLVPEEHIESLQHALETRYEPSEDELQPLAKGVAVQRYPFQRIPLQPGQPVVHPKSGLAYEKAGMDDLTAYKAARAKAEAKRDSEHRQRLRERGLVA